MPFPDGVSVKAEGWIKGVEAGISWTYLCHSEIVDIKFDKKLQILNVFFFQILLFDRDFAY